MAHKPTYEELEQRIRQLECEAEQNKEMAKRLDQLRTVGVIERKEGKATRVFATVQDITDLKRAEEALVRRSEFQRLVGEMSSEFLGLTSDQIDGGIERALKTIATFSGADRAYVFLLHHNGALADNTHEWCAEGIKPQIESLKNIPLGRELPWFAKHIEKCEVFHVPNVAELPPGARLEREHLEAQGIRSLIAVPMLLRGRLVGFLGFDAVRDYRSWTEDDQALLWLIGQILTNAIERKRSDEALRESEEKYRSIFDSAQVGIFRTRISDGKVLDCNDRYAKLHGYETREACIEDFHVTERYIDSHTRERLIASLLKDGKVNSFEACYRKKDGGHFWARFSAQAFPEKDYLEGVGFDITEEKRKQKELLESEAKYRRLAENSPAVVYQFMMRQDGSFVFPYISEAVRDVMGISPEEVLNDSSKLLGMVHPEDRDSFHAGILKSADSLDSYHEIIRCIKDGELKWIEARATPGNTSTGDILWDGFFNDVTEQKLAEISLRESEERFSKLFFSSPTWMAITRLEDGAYLEVNKAFEHITGFDRNEIIGRTSLELGILADPDKRNRLIEMAREKGGFREQEVTFNTKSGEAITALWSAEIMELAGETCLLSTIMDISELRRSKKEKLRNEKDLRESQRIAHLGSWRLDLKSNEVFWTEELYRMYGFDPTLPPPPYTEHRKLFTPESWALLSASLERARETGIPYELELEMVRKDGSRGWIWVRGEAITDSKGKTVGLWGAAQDISERKRMEEALRRSQEKYKHLFNEAQVALFRTNIDGTLVEINERYAQTAGYETVEECMTDFNAGEAWADRKSRDELIRKLFLDGSVNDYEAEIVRRDGTHIWINFSATIYREKGYIEGSLIDVTSRKRAEEDRERLRAQLNQTQKMEAVGNLAGGIAHEFNNILFPIMGLGELLLEDLSPESLEHQNAQQILKAAERGSDLVKQILTFSRRTGHKMMPIRIQNVLKEALKLARSTIPANIDIEQHIQTDCGLVNADATQVHQIVMNLITNAFHAVEHSDGKINVRLKEVSLDDEDIADLLIAPGEYAMLTVSDTGCGIEPMIIENIFEPYFTTKEQGKGTGLGLAVVYGIIKEHQGGIKVSSEPNAGTTFTVYLPLMGKPDEPGSMEKNVKYETGNEHILLVDDEKPILHVERQMLERLGYQVTTRTSSPDALETFAANPESYDMVISDMSMPNMTGDKLAQRLISIRSDIPIIICTGFSERIDKRSADSIGVKGLLMKPISKSEMAQMVRNVFDAAKATAQEK